MSDGSIWLSIFLYSAKVPNRPRVEITVPILVFKSFILVSSVCMKRPVELECFMVFHLFLPTSTPHPPKWARWRHIRKQKRVPRFIMRGEGRGAQRDEDELREMISKRAEEERREGNMRRV